MEPVPRMTESASFQLESQLCSVLSSALLQALDEERATVLKEVQVGLVIPDFMVVSAAGSRSIVGELTGFESWIVADLLRVRCRRPDTLASRLFARPEKTAEALLRLERKGAIYRSSATSVSLRDDWFPRSSEVVAVEAKVLRWRQAIEQAAEYLRFANRSYVALPQETLRGRKAAAAVGAACRSRGVGLMSVSTQGVELVRKAPLHRPASAGWVWVVCRALSTCAKKSKRLRERSSKPSGAPELSAR